MKAFYIGVCAECGNTPNAHFITSAFEEYDPSHYMTVNGPELLKVLHGWEGVCQELGEHWYEDHSHRLKYDFAIVRRTVDPRGQVLVIGHGREHKKSGERCSDAEAWARSYIEVKEYDDGL